MPSSEHTPSRLTPRYTEGGDRAVTRFEEGVAGYETRYCTYLIHSFCILYAFTPLLTSYGHTYTGPSVASASSARPRTRSLMVRS